MKKLINLLKHSLYITGLCGLLSVGIFTHDQTKQKVQPVSAISSSVPDLSSYTPYDVYNSSFYFDWTYLTYDSLSSSSNSNQSSVRSNLRQLNQQPSNIEGLYYNFDESFNFSATFGYFYADFYSYCDANGDSVAEFTLFDAIFFNGDNFLYRIKSNGGLPNIYSSYTDVWVCAEARNILFVSSYTGTSFVSFLYTHGTFYQFYEVEDLINQISTLTSEIEELQEDYDELHDDYVQAQDDIDLYERVIGELEDEISTLESEISTLESQLNNAFLSARQSTYIVDVKSMLNYEFQIFVNVNYQSNQDFYIKPTKITCNSSIEVTDARGDGQESHFNVIDILDLSNLITSYYYSYSDLYNYLYVNVNDVWNLEIPYYDDGEVAHFDLVNINTYIDDWLMTYKSDISISTSYEYFRSAMVEYNNLISGSLSGTNMSYLDGYNNGYDEGYLYGQSEGYSLGYGLGYENGVSTDSTVASIFSGILQVGLVPINFFLAIFNFEILGINLSGFIRALFTVAITVIILRVVLGGKGGED